MPVKKTAAPFVDVQVDGVDIGIKRLFTFEWKAFANGGYIIRFRLSDPYFHESKRAEIIKKYFAKARADNPIVIKFRIGWSRGDTKLKTERRVAYITDLDVYGDFAHAQLEFVAVDPSTWLLNRGNGNGKVYKGKVSDVIKNVVKEYAPGVQIEVTETDDDSNGRWAMMRQDPQRFIQSLLDWSVDLVKGQQSHWVILSDGPENGSPKLLIKQQHDHPNVGQNLGSFNSSINQGKINDLWDYSLITNNMLSAYQSRLVTQGISSVSGKFIDKKTDPKKAEIKDENTKDKLKPNIDSEKSFFKPNTDNATSIIAIPEHNAGEVGIKYEDYIGGRPKNLFLTMLPTIMRIRIKLNGTRQFEDPLKLGVSTVKINWKDLEGKDFFLAGRWIVYGFHHEVTRKYWYTNAYLYRLDHDASGREI